MNTYSISLEGFNASFSTLAELATYVAELKAERPYLVGKTARVTPGHRVGTCTQWFLQQSRELVVSP